MAGKMMGNPAQKENLEKYYFTVGTTSGGGTSQAVAKIVTSMAQAYTLAPADTAVGMQVYDKGTGREYILMLCPQAMQATGLLKVAAMLRIHIAVQMGCLILLLQLKNATQIKQSQVQVYQQPRNIRSLQRLTWLLLLICQCLVPARY